MFPNPEMKSRLAHMHQREHDGSLRERDHLCLGPLTVETDDDVARIYNSAGAGCFAQPREYCGQPFFPSSLS